jgi:hypothetical protein
MSVLLKSGMSAPMSTHTPGPWKADNWSDISVNRNGKPTLVARAWQSSHDMPSHPIKSIEAAANARLIAAAPDLLAALNEILVIVNEGTKECHKRGGTRLGNIDDVARAAIAKAEGTS